MTALVGPWYDHGIITSDVGKTPSSHPAITLPLHSLQPALYSPVYLTRDFAGEREATDPEFVLAAGEKLLSTRFEHREELIFC